MDWHNSEFILEFVAMVAHCAHMSTPPFKTKDCVMMVFTPYPNKSITEVLSFGNVTHSVSVVFNSSQFAVLYHNIAACTVLFTMGKIYRPTVMNYFNQCVTKYKKTVEG